MLFSSLTFVYIFLPILLSLYFLVNNAEYRKFLLIAFSLVFYAWGEPIYVLLMIIITFINYFCGRKIGTSVRKSKRKIYLCTAIILNLLILIIFKYLNMFVDTLNLLPYFNIEIPYLALPLGISFYTFQAMSYTVDVYRQDVKPQKNFSYVLLYISFFPQLVAGPIVRYKDIIQDLKNRETNYDDIFDGAFRFSIGLLKKVLIANSIGKCATSLLSFSGNDVSLLAQWAGIFCYALQIYFDFSAYSDMAIALGRIFGFHFMENFNFPYISTTITEFWRRWHISLSTFFRDYVYIPLGGKYKYQLRNILIVWLLTGLWHGASWNFSLWGLYYAILLIIEKYVFFRIKINATVQRIIGFIYVVFATLIGWTIFYYTNFNDLLNAFKNMLLINKISLTNIYAESIIKENLLLIILSVVLATPVVKIIFKKFETTIGENETILVKTTLIILFMFISTACLVGESYNPFLYFRF